jgi:pimeloyl-ACP methyl ester carboxylesterase
MIKLFLSIFAIFTLFYGCSGKTLYKTAVNISAFQASLEKKSLNIQGYKISYYESKNSKKDTLFIIHGFGDNKESWLGVAKKLKKDFHLIIPDLLGCGESDKPLDFDYSLASQSEFLKKFLKKFTNDRDKNYYLLAHSMGGALAMMLWDELPIKALILVSPMGVKVKSSKGDKEVLKVMDEGGEHPLLNLCTTEKFSKVMDFTFYKKPSIPNSVFEYITKLKCQDSQIEKIKYSAIIDLKTLKPKDDLSTVATSVTLPTLIVWGEDDAVLDKANGERLNTLIKNSTLKIYNKCGHMVGHEKPKELSADVESFIHSLKHSEFQDNGSLFDK